MKVFIAFLFFASAFANDSFITALEYGKMLYENPRGIGCVECHGFYGEGGNIANYTHKRKNRILIAPQINSLDFKSFKNALQKGKKVMPKYYLTNEEIEAIYQYLAESKKQQEYKN
ncbi:MAG: cytochrome c [Helicobacter sp.]|nr:cytochrome c [Helicobacteraceae bacterium]MDY3113992.1 cytochrome c [Helicobacter sp.]